MANKKQKARYQRFYEWQKRADDDIRAMDAMFKEGGGLPNPICFHAQQSAKKYLLSLVDSVIFKDLLELKTIANRPAALNLLRLLAHQIGSLVNKAELANRLGIDMATVKRYLTLFEQSLIIFPLFPFTGRRRDKISKMSKLYFYDVSLRNALIENFQPQKLFPNKSINY